MQLQASIICVLGDMFATSRRVSYIKGNPSCSSGWLRLLVQSIFAVFTVTSFILIVKLSWPRSTPTHPSQRCHNYNCRVQCKDAPYFNTYEDDILRSVAKVAAENCNGVHLVLEGPMFTNGTLPVYFLSQLRFPILSISFIGGNLMRIPPNAFMSQYNGLTISLQLQKVTIDYWVPDSLVGLSNLKELYITNCKFANTPDGILRAVDDTLETLIITNSYNWDPIQYTGTTTFLSLHTVDFSTNNFGNILQKNSFKGLATCKVLYLNSCQITSIRAGTFDHLTRIELIFLNNNLLTTIPSGLFDVQMPITYPRPRINLHDNPWHCDCSNRDFKLLVLNDLLMVEPICDYPVELKGKTFTEFERHCYNNSLLNIIPPNTFNVQYVTFQNDYVQTNEVCNDTQPSTNISLRVISPTLNSNCVSNTITNINILRSFTSETPETEPGIRWLRIKYYISTESFSMVQLDTPKNSEYGLLWYQSSCPSEVYCINTLPKCLRVYNDDISSNYTFCPVVKDSGIVEAEQCVVSNFQIETTKNTQVKHYHVFVYLIIAVFCLIIGAFCVYGLVLKHPTLLKGSKRILFVKHKAVEALVLPPKVPLRSDIINDDVAFYDKNTFIMPSMSRYTTLNQLMRSKSVRSNKSNSPSYISALHPTEDQLAEWRGTPHYDNDITTTSIRSDLSIISWIYSGDPLVYSHAVDGERTHESLK